MTSPDKLAPVSEELLTYVDLREANIARQAAWCPDQVPDLSFRGNELAGETGEVCNVIKKLERERLGWRGSRDTVGHLAEELADVVICADLCALSAGIDLDEAVAAKFNATSEKVGLPHRLARRTAPSTGEVTEEMVERAAIAFWQYVYATGRPFRAERGPKNAWMFVCDDYINLTDAIRAALAAAPPAGLPQCCMCGKKGLSTVEGDGGGECELWDGRWVCSADCYYRAVPDDTDAAPVASGVEAAPASVEVKPLVWRELTSSREDGPAEPTGDFEAITMIGEYSVCFDEEDPDVADTPWCVWAPDECLDYFSTPDEAKAVAQADYEARIRSALVNGGTHD